MVMETQIQKDIIEYLHARNIRAWRTNSGKARYNIKLAPNGTPDIIGYLPGGKFLGIEVKKPGCKPSEEQLKWHADAQEQGCAIIVAHSLDDVVRRLG